MFALHARVVWCVLGMIPGLYVPSVRDGCGVSLQNCTSRRPLHLASWHGITLCVMVCVRAICTGWLWGRQCVKVAPTVAAELCFTTTTTLQFMVRLCKCHLYGTHITITLPHASLACTERTTARGGGSAASPSPPHAHTATAASPS